MKRNSYRSLRDYVHATRAKQEDLANRLGVSQAHLSMILAGKRNPSVRLALLIERVTGVSVRNQVREEA